MKREYPDSPIVAIGVVVLNQGGDRVLLVRRGKEPNRGRWSLPGGAVELNETVRQAAAREIREECSVEIEVSDTIEVLDAITPNQDGHPKFHYVLVELLGRHVSGDPQAADDAAEIGWFHRDELERLDLPAITKAVIEAGIALRVRESDRTEMAVKKLWQREYWS